MAPKNTICLWYERAALEAARFYAETFPDSKVGRVCTRPATIPTASRATATVESPSQAFLRRAERRPDLRQEAFRQDRDRQQEDRPLGDRSFATAARKAKRWAGPMGVSGRSRHGGTEGSAIPIKLAKRVFDAMMR